MSDTKKLEIIQGDGKELEISNVTKYLTISKPKAIEKTNKNIIVPVVQKSKENSSKKEK